MTDTRKPSAQHPQPDTDVLEQAAQWFVLLASGVVSHEEQARWQHWRSADPAHEQAWARVEAASAPFAAVPRQRVPAALRALTRKPAARRTISSVVLACVLGVVGWQSYRLSDWSADAMTAVGQQRELHLADGSRLLLDTDSAIDIDFDRDERLVRLRRGRLLIETGHVPAYREQPFVVATAQGRSTALGTKFTVEQQPGETRVAVIEARVAVRADAGGDGDVTVEQGHSARFNSDGVIEQDALDRNDTAWQRGMLIADDLPLPDFLAALDRYRSDALICDPAVAALHISGAFPLRDTERALAALAETLPVRIERGDNGMVTVRAK